MANSIAVVKQGYVGAGLATMADEHLQGLIARGVRHDLRLAEAGEGFRVAVETVGYMSCGYYADAAVVVGGNMTFEAAKVEADRINAREERRWRAFLNG